jgi:hypothetical protein
LAPGAAGACHTFPAAHLVFTAVQKKVMLPLPIKAVNHFLKQIKFKLAGHVNNGNWNSPFLFQFLQIRTNIFA